MKPIRSYGSWPSSISAAYVAISDRRIADLQVDRAAADGVQLYWLENQPQGGGRTTIMTLGRDGMTSCLDAPMSVHSSVYEFGGGAYVVHAGFIWFVNAEDQAIWIRDPEGNLAAITEPDADTRFADLQYDTRLGRLIAVAEDLDVQAEEPRSRVVCVHRDGHVETIADDHDFHASPRLAPDNTRLVWLAWNHPHMPWELTQLWQARIDEQGRIGEPEPLWCPEDASLFGPVFDPEGQLHIVADVDNWWNIYQENVTGDGFVALTRETGEFGVPQWGLGQSTYAFTDNGQLFALLNDKGIWYIGTVDRETGEFITLRRDFDYYEQLTAYGNEVAVVAASSIRAKHIRHMDAQGAGDALRAADSLPVDVALSRPEPISWPTGDDETAYGLFYPPASERWDPPEDERPPLIIKCHGGPTGATDTALDARIQYWTSRGYAVLDVNYRGSTGYGRAYRLALNGSWGVSDVQDCQTGVDYLVKQDRIDPARVLISGASAGGYTVLSVLTFTNLAAAGTSYYGIGDLESLIGSTHKFESRYIQRLIGGQRQLLEERSPLYHADQLSCPVLFLQGGADKIVPPDQAETMVAALRDQSVPVAYLRFDNEGHGFRQADNIMAALEAERSFYTRVLGISDVEDLEPLTIENLEEE